MVAMVTTAMAALLRIAQAFQTTRATTAVAEAKSTKVTSNAAAAGTFYVRDAVCFQLVLIGNDPTSVAGNECCMA